MGLGSLDQGSTQWKARETKCEKSHRKMGKQEVNQICLSGDDLGRILSGKKLYDKISTNLVKQYDAVASMTAQLESTARQWKTLVVIHPLFFSSIHLFCLLYATILGTGIFQQQAWVCSNMNLPHPHNHTHPLYSPDKKRIFFLTVQTLISQHPVGGLFLYLHLRSYHSEFIRNCTQLLIGQ